MTVHLVHGFNVSDGGEDSICLLARHLDGAVRPFDYGWTGLAGLSCANRRAVLQLLRRIKPGDSLVAHSNGCLIAWKVAQLTGAKLASIVCINPALRRDTRWPNGTPVLCLANSTDWVVQLGRIWGRLFPIDGIEAQGWGAAGRYGFTGNQSNVSNWDTAESYWYRPVKGHSGIFADAYDTSYWGGLIGAWIKAVNRSPHHA